MSWFDRLLPSISTRPRSNLVPPAITTQATQQDASRPTVQNTGLASTLSEAQDFLDSPSGRHSETDLSRLGDELGISAGPTTDAESAAAAAAQPRDENTALTNDSAGDMPDSNPVLKSSAVSASAAAAVAAAPAAAAAGGGEGTDDSATGKGRKKDYRASFDGYDFNTLRKVGSLQLGGAPRNQGGGPELAGARPMGARGHEPT